MRRTAPAQPSINCTYAALQKHLNAACWNQLDLPSYLTGWNKTTPTCPNDSSNDADCCRGGEAWASCFQRLATGTPESCQMGTLNDITVCFDKPRALRSSLGPKIVDQVGYGLQTIQNINTFFADYGSGRSILQPDNAKNEFLFQPSTGTRLRFFGSL